MGNRVVVIAPAVATILALVWWHVAPSRSWAWLLLVGALCAVLYGMTQLAPDLFSGAEWPEVVPADTLSGPPVTAVGLFGVVAAVVAIAAARPGWTRLPRG